IITGLLASNRPGLTDEVREAISQMLNARDLGTGADSAPPQYRRYLRVRNDTKQQLTVWVRYRTLTTGDEWAWFPEGPEEAVSYELAPDETTFLKHQGVFVNASRVRLWARPSAAGPTESGGWTKYRDQDLWLVREVDNGEHVYHND